MKSNLSRPLIRKDKIDVDIIHNETDPSCRKANRTIICSKKKLYSTLSYALLTSTLNVGAGEDSGVE